MKSRRRTNLTPRMARLGHEGRKAVRLDAGVDWERRAPAWNYLSMARPSAFGFAGDGAWDKRTGKLARVDAPGTTMEGAFQPIRCRRRQR